MPERYSDEHLRLLEQGIPVYPGDEALIADMARNVRAMSTRYPNQQHPAVTGAPMAGNVTPRFGMDTARQRSTNLGLPSAKRKTVKTISADPAVADKVVETIEDEVPRSQYDIMMEQFADHAANTTPDLPNVLGISDAEAEAQGLTAEQDESGLWWWIDAIGKRYRARQQATAEQFPPNKWNMTYDPEYVGIPGHPFETTAQREQRLAGAESNGQEQTDTGTGERPPLPDTVVTATRPQPTFRQGDVTARIYNNWARDIPTERKDYLRAMKDIYFKMSMLSAVASLTGGEDQSEGFGRMQVEMLNYMMETDNQDRLLKIHKGVYFDKDGNWDPPKNERMAHQRAVRFGAGPDEASEFTGFYPKTEGMWQNWIVTDADGNEFIKASQGGPPPGYPEFRLATAGVGLGKERFRTFKLEFDAATTPNGKNSVASRYARALKEAASGGFMYQPPTDGEIKAAYNELKGDFEPTDIKKEG